MELCGLCNLPRALKDSHLLPKSLYKTLMNAYPDSELVASDTTKKSLHYAGKQITSLFLCNECEGDLNRFGENHVVKECFKNQNNFVLREKVACTQEITITEEGRLINARKMHGFEYEKYLYFAASIFWRASAWPRNIDNYKNALGDVYQEQFRLYLRQKSEFPTNAYLVIYVDSGKKAAPLMMPPVVLSKNNCHHHEFFIPGLRFYLYLGSMVGEIKKLSKSEDTKVFIIEYDFIKHERFKNLANLIRNEYSPKGRLAKSQKNV